MSQSFDPTSIVFDNYVVWKGAPINIAKPSQLPPQLSPHFSILEYQADTYNSFCTAGASYNVVPHSIRRFKDPRGVRYEYIMHGSDQIRDEIHNALLMVAAYPFLQNFMYYAGCVIPTGGQIFGNSPMQYLYFTYPYEDDPNVYTSQPHGQMDRSEALIQTLWVFPIHRSEAHYIEHTGPDDFERLCQVDAFKAYDVSRAPLV